MIQYVLDVINMINIKTPSDILNYMDNIEYGYIGLNGEKHINSLKGFRKNYRTLSIEQILEYKIGTCIEQVLLMHELLNNLNIKNKKINMIKKLAKSLFTKYKTKSVFYNDNNKMIYHFEFDVVSMLNGKNYYRVQKLKLIDKKMNNDKSIIHFYLMFIYYAAMLQVFQQVLVLKKNY